MKKLFVIFILSFVMMHVACEKNESTLFEDTGKKMDQGMRNMDQNMHDTAQTIDAGFQKAGAKIQEGYNKVEEEAKNVTE